MADVQLEHGYTRLANRLLEAWLANDFTATQMRILLALTRLTYGWSRTTVQLSDRELATCANVQYSGGFRGALRELTAEGVVDVERSADRKTSTWGLQKDFHAWGRFSVHENKLKSGWGVRPQEGTPLEGRASTEADGLPLQGQTTRPLEGRPTDAKSSKDADLAARKERKEIERKLPSPPTHVREGIVGNSVDGVECEPETLGGLLEGQAAADLGTLLFHVKKPATRDRWRWAIRAHLDGMGGHRKATAAQIGVALGHMALNDAEPNAALWDAYLRRAIEAGGDMPAQRQPSGKAGGSGGGNDAGEALLWLGKIRERHRDGTWLRSLPTAVRAALSAVGGVRRVSTTGDEWWGVLGTQFSRAYLAALANPEQIPAQSAVRFEPVPVTAEPSDDGRWKAYAEAQMAAVNSWRKEHSAEVLAIEERSIPALGMLALKSPTTLAAYIHDQCAKAIGFPLFADWQPEPVGV